MSLIYKNHKITAEVQLYDWYDVNELGDITESQGHLLDGTAMTIVQWNVMNETTGEEYWLMADDHDFASVKAFIDKQR